MFWAGTFLCSIKKERTKKMRKKYVNLSSFRLMYMLSSSRYVRRINSQIMADKYTFDTVKEFIYLGSVISLKNTVCLEINSRITLANRCCYGLNGQLSNRDLSRTTKLILYRSLILSALLYGVGAWTLLSTDAAGLRVFERKDAEDDFRIRYKSELYEFLNDVDVEQCINIQLLRWFGCRSNGGGYSGETGRSALKTTALYTLEEPNRGSPVIDWCDQLV